MRANPSSLHRSKRRALYVGFFALILGGAAFARPAAADPDTLSVPMFGDEREQLWPIELEIRVVAEGEGERWEAPPHTVVVANGQTIRLERRLASPQGQGELELEICARHLAGSTVELEYEMQVEEARYRRMSWGDYFLHRLRWAAPQLEPAAVSDVRADIVATKDGTHRELIRVGERRFEVVLRARRLRG